MISLLADENISLSLIEGLRQRVSTVDIVRVQDVGLIGFPDTQVLDYSARTNRTVLTLDNATFPDHAYDRVVSGSSFPGVIVIRRKASTSKILTDLELVLSVMTEADMRNVVYRVPL